MAPRREVTHLFEDDDARPADVLIPNWTGGQDLCVDVTIISPMVGGMRNNELAATRAEERKALLYDHRCRDRGLLFLPFVLETTGAFGAKTNGFVERLGVALADAERTDVPSTIARIRQTISVAAQRSMAEGFLFRH